MYHTWSANRYAHSRFSSQVSIGGGSIDGGLFISETYESNAKIHCLLGNINDWEARKAKYDLDIEVY